MSRQIELANSLHIASPEYQAVARRFRTLGAVAIAMVIAIVFLMVTKLSF